MMLAAASAIQISTLVVAGLAVVTTLAGIFVNAFLARRSEHKTWQRDLRVRIYSDCTATGDRISRLLSEYSAGWARQNPQGVVAPMSASDFQQESVDLVRQLLSNVGEVHTFGARSVGPVARKFGTAVVDAMLCLGNSDTFDEAKAKAHIGVATEALIEFRSSVRKSMEISDG